MTRMESASQIAFWLAIIPSYYLRNDDSSSSGILSHKDVENSKSKLYSNKADVYLS